jgi:hypothetical protein
MSPASYLIRPSVASIQILLDTCRPLLAVTGDSYAQFTNPGYARPEAIDVGHQYFRQVEMLVLQRTHR